MLRCALLTLAAILAGYGRADAQLGALLSPGALTRAHGALEGIANCEKCHERGKQVSAVKCLSCHKPVADRITKQAGIHKDAKGECVTCHVEHTGADGELRPFDQAAFDHAGVARFAIDGKHAVLAGKCAACHRTRSFLTLSATCQSCHKDVHNGTLGPACASCHTTQVAFKEVTSGGRFDHAKAAFPLTGAHASVACASCHANRVYKGLSFSSCTSCHKDRHQPTFGPVCSTCHTTDAWKTTKIDHGRTVFPLVGRHALAACASCHKQGAMRVKPRSDTCAACHVDVHRGTFKQDCKSCHNEGGFAKAPFDHSQTRFPLEGKHAPIACAACHKTMIPGATPTARRVADFRGLGTSCVSCHADVHGGELGVACESCHTASTFEVTRYTHQRLPDFFGGQHAPVTCGGCHTASDGGPVAALTRVPVPVAGASAVNRRFKTTSTTCVSCHKDVHLGQVGLECQGCHTVQDVKFATRGFPHGTTAFPLTGAHARVACALCHKSETGVFPAGTGTAVRLKGVAVACRACHQDIHIGQVDGRCETCHSTDEFRIPAYKHRSTQLRDFFVGRHDAAKCVSCHPTVTKDFPAGRGTAVAFRVDTRCTACHRDEHNGALPDCVRCHQP